MAISEPAYFIMDFRANLFPAVERTLFAKFFNRADGAIEGYPRHHFREHEVPSAAANLPNALVRLRPDLFEVRDQRFLQSPACLQLGQAFSPRLVQRIENLAVDIQLKLLRGGIPDPYRLRSFIALQLSQLKFGQPPFSGDAVHDL